MVQAPHPIDFILPAGNDTELNFRLPDPADEQISEAEFQRQIETVWQVCDRFDLQTEIWRGRTLRAVREREKCHGDRRGSGFLNWLQAHEISKSQAYSLIELANSADVLLEQEELDSDALERFSKRAFIETAQAAPEVQQMISESARSGDRITRREVRQLADEWTSMTSALVPSEVREKVSTQTIPSRYLAPLVRELEKLPEAHQTPLTTAISQQPDLDTLKKVTAEARHLARYLEATTQVQALDQENLDLESALAEALRLDCLNSTAELVNQAAQLEQLATKLYLVWKRINTLVERLYLDSGSSTPHLRSLLDCLSHLSGEVIEVQFSQSKDGGVSRQIRLQVQTQDL